MEVAGGGVLAKMSMVGKSVCVVSSDVGPRDVVGVEPAEGLFWQGWGVVWMSRRVSRILPPVDRALRWGQRRGLEERPALRREICAWRTRRSCRLGARVGGGILLFGDVTDQEGLIVSLSTTVLGHSVKIP